MIEEALLKSNFIGKDGFVWWLGQIAHSSVWADKSEMSLEGVKDGTWSARCKVRIVGHHTFDGGVLSDDDLPWAHIMMDPAFGSLQGGMGSTINLKGGESCFGFFLDGDDGQQPVVVGLLYRSAGVKNIISEELIAKEKSSRFKPFTGHPGNVIPSTQRSARADKTTVPSSTTSTQTPPLPQTDLVKLAFDPTVGFTTGNTKVYPQYGDRLIFDSASLWSVAKKADITVTLPNGCQNDLIGQITQVLQDFMAVTNGLDKYLNKYIDPVLNEIVDIANIIGNTARSIGGVIKLIINSLRNTIFKCIVWAFRKLVGLVVPPPQQTIVLEAMKKILDTIFCMLEKLNLIPFITNLLNGLVDSTLNVPLCAAEEWTAGVLAELMNQIENILGPVLSGINWLTGGLGTISNILNQASSLASKIFSFLECTGLACKTPTVWASKFGTSEKEADDWEKAVKNINVFKGAAKVGTVIEDVFGQTALYRGGFGQLVGDVFSPNNCYSKTTNPQTQDDLMPMPIGSRWVYCIPPVVRIIGNGVGAKAIPIVGQNGSIFSVEILGGGTGYIQGKTTVQIVDNSGYGLGATADVIVNDNGEITSIYLINVGSGYCGGNYSQLGTTENAGIGTNISGNVDSVVVVSPGYGYTTGDTIGDGKNTYTPIVSPNGSIVDVIRPTNTIGGFDITPALTINTNTGVGAEVIPIMKFTPSYVSGISTTSTVGIAVTSVIDCV